MTHTIEDKGSGRIVLITIANPVDVRNEPNEIVNELQPIVGDVNDTFYLIYDMRNVTINFGDIISGITSFARQTTEFEKHLNKYGRMILVGTSALVSVSAKAAARFSPERAFVVFKTAEEALEHARSEITKQ
ncbi:MAG: hypothetical protein JXB30_11930 [Anaerolineae bacterium]|nr:hypothetical protein [Anaerolineae bacterium]